jgi:hypothetical protein
VIAAFPLWSSLIHDLRPALGQILLLSDLPKLSSEHDLQLSHQHAAGQVDYAPVVFQSLP